MIKKRKAFLRPKILRAIGLLWLFSCILLLSAIQSTLADLPPPAAASILTTVDSAGNVGWHTSLALNGSGYPVISYYDVTNDDLKVAVCNNATCTQPTLTAVDTHGDVGRYTSLALTSSDTPIISYFDNTNDDPKVAVCNDIACTTPTLTTVDGPGSVGWYTSLALNSTGYPVISYYDATNGELKMAVFKFTTANPDFKIYLPLIVR